MATFLNAVAASLLKKFGNNLSNVTVVFPNKRASLFLNEELILQSGNHAVWSPNYLTISELFRQNSNLVVADNIQLVCELHKHYTEITGSAESLDDFYGWGELMLSDFDDLDKNMGDASLIFENTGDLHAFDDNTFLNEEQVQILQRFFSHFSDDNDSVLKERFTALWNNLYNIYTSFRESLASQQLAYEGMLYRDVVDNNTLEVRPDQTYVFVGFNLLQKVEQILFERLARENKALFYWDYDKYYMTANNEAGKYILQNMKAFPNELAEMDIYDNLSHKPSIAYVAASTEDAQMRYISQWLTPERIKAGKRTAIVLCDESMLPTVMHCLPEEVKDVNITTGYPLYNTPAVSLISTIFSIKTEGYSATKKSLRLSRIESALRHPYMKYISKNADSLLSTLKANHVFYPTVEEVSLDDALTDLFAPLPDYEDAVSSTEAQRICGIELLSCIQRMLKTASEGFLNDAENTTYEKQDNAETIPENKKPSNQLTRESIYRIYQIVGRVLALIEKGELAVSIPTLQALLQQIFRTSTVPFHGEPIMGIQIMGVLETRNLDFDNILILSCNEGNMPKGVNDASFIPHTIRKAYSLTTIDNKVAIFAYYFHRMIQRASDITMTYNNESGDIKSNEMSRFMMQLMAESKIKINPYVLTTNLEVCNLTPAAVIKNESVVKRMNEIKQLSPTALNEYLRCPVKFYYRFVCGIKDKEEDTYDEIDNCAFGSIFHKAAELIYKPFLGRAVTGENIKSLIDNDNHIKDIVDQAFKEVLFKINDENKPMPKLNGTQEINRRIVIRLIENMLRYDSKHPFTLYATEMQFNHGIEIDTDTGKRPINITGVIDRLDLSVIDGVETLRVVDYKTGTKEHTAPAALNEIFDHETTHQYYLQTLLYCIMLPELKKAKEFTKNRPIAPSLLYPALSKKEGYNPVIKFGDDPISNALVYADEFKEHLNGLLQEIFDYSKPFTPTSDPDTCKYCFYKKFCGNK